MARPFFYQMLQTTFHLPTDTESNPELELARQLTDKTGVNIFLTGRAGTGKTTFLHRLRKECTKRMIVTAPTGIAAINAGGVTLHSFFQLPFSPFITSANGIPATTHSRKFTKDKSGIIRSLDLLVIDEISMVRADLLDAVDAVLRYVRKNPSPFGGVQLLMIGDPHQLPPVVTDKEAPLLEQHYPSPYFFESHALHKSGFVTVELRKVYRQDEGAFLDILNAMRDNTLSDQHLKTLNSRLNFNDDNIPEGVIRLTTHNAASRRINEERLASLPGNEHIFSAEIDGTFPETSYPADAELRLKEGAQVMFIRNDSSGQHKYYNGLIGKITSIENDRITVDTPESEIHLVKEEWANNRYSIDKETSEIKEVREGSFRQYPLRLAWAITIHKSQGLTFDRAVIDASRSFAHGQAYVALSRCRTLEGMTLSAPLSRAAVICDPVIARFAEACRQTQPSSELLESYKSNYTLSLLNDLFNFRPLLDTFDDYYRVVAESFGMLYPKLCEDYSQCLVMIRDKMADVGARFIRQICDTRTPENGILDNPSLQPRIAKGMKYYLDHLSEIAALVARTPTTCNKNTLKTRLADRRQALEEQLCLTVGLCRVFSSEPFSAATYTQERGKILAGLPRDIKKQRTDRTAKRRKKSPSHREINDI